MQRLLLARECGEEPKGLDDDALARWTRLEADQSRLIQVQFCNEGFTFIDIDRTEGVLILCGGRNDVDPTSPDEAALALFRYPEPRVEVNAVPLVTARCGDTAPASVTCASWFSDDTALFVTGMLTNRQVHVWDTSRFTIVASFPLGLHSRPDSCVHTVALSQNPSARSELVATACHDLSHVTLVDLESGSTTHVLRSDHPSAPVHDVVWSTTNPHHLASIDVSGRIALFDIRRSGAVACLLTMTERSPSLPRPIDRAISTLPHPGPPLPPANPPRFSKKSLRKKRVLKRRDNMPSPQNRVATLGLACAWRPLSSSLHDPLRSPPPSSWQDRHLLSPGQVRSKLHFTPDGSTLVSRRVNRGFFTHDVFTGRLLKSFRGGATTSPTYEMQLGFEMARDGEHIITNFEGALCMIDVRDGRLIHMTSQRTPELFALTLHPFEEEVFSVHAGRITCWSDITKLEAVHDEERRNGGSQTTSAVTY